MFLEDSRQLQKEWLNLAENGMDELIELGRALAETLKKRRRVFAFGIGLDHLFAEELTARLGGHEAITGLFPSELMSYDRRMPWIAQCADYSTVLMKGWGLQREDGVLSFSSSDSALAQAMQKNCRRSGVQWLALGAKSWPLSSPFLPVFQVYAAQAVNAVSFATLAEEDAVETMHRLNKEVLAVLEHLEKTQQGNVMKVVETMRRHRGRLFILGSGHSHMLQDVAAAMDCPSVVPVLEPELMVFDPQKTARTQKQRDYASSIIEQFQITDQDVVLLPSNTGNGIMNIELAYQLWQNRTTVAVFTNMRQSPVIRSLHPSGRRLFETADIVIDNGCVNRDLSLTIGGQRRCPLSSLALLSCGILLLRQLKEVLQEEEDEEERP